MAMKEIKTFEVEPGTEEATIQLWQTFGWELVGAPQEIYNRDSHLERKSNDMYSVTTTTHYIKLTFERDPKREHYNELKSLEEQYYAIEEPDCPDAPRFITILWVILIGVGFVAYVIPGIILLVLHIIFHIKKSKAYNEDYASYTRKCAEISTQREEILTKAQALV